MDNLINFGDFCRYELELTCQYGYHYFKGLAGSPELGIGLVLHNSEICYHSAEISEDDAIIFGIRLLGYREFSMSHLKQGKLCTNHNVWFENTCPKCRDMALPVQHSRGKNKLFKS